MAEVLTMIHLGYAHTRAGWDLALSDIKKIAQRINAPSLSAKLFGSSRQDAIEDLRGQFRTMVDAMTSKELQQVILQLNKDPGYSQLCALLPAEVQRINKVVDP